MKRIVLSALTILGVSGLVVGGTQAVFTDTETSNGNTFAAGTLDLNIDGGDTNVVKFNLPSLRPGNQPKGSYTLANVGTINGYLDVTDISFSSDENGCIDPEVDALDVTCGDPGTGEGELADVLNIRLFVDRDGDGWIGGGDTVFYNGLVKDLPADFTSLNEPVNAGDDTKIVALFDWWSTPDDNKAQGDSMTLNLGFTLSQNP